MSNPSYQQGYEDAYAEIYRNIDDDDHPRICGGACRPCGVVRTALENSLLRLGLMMEPEDYQTFTEIIARVNEAKQLRGNMNSVLVKRAKWAGRRCYETALNYNGEHKVKAILYRAAAATRDAITIVEIMRNLHEPDTDTFIDDEFLDTIHRLADARKWQAVQYQTLNRDNLPREYLDMVVEAFASSGEVYASIDAHMDDVPPDMMGSILDADIPASYAIIAGFDAHNCGEDAYDVGEYYPAILAYRASYIAYEMAHIDIDSYSSDATKTNPLLKDIDGIARVANQFRNWEKSTAKLINIATTEAGALAVESAAEALRRAADAAEHAVSNLRAARLLDDEGW